jgi:hypothetical protein
MKVLRTLKKVSRDVRNFFAAERVVVAPFTWDLKQYSLEKLRADVWSAANVTVLALAQGIAFAAIAGLPVVYGIISTAVAAFVAPLFAGSRHTILGPTNATAFMLFSFFAVNPDLMARAGWITGGRGRLVQGGGLAAVHFPQRSGGIHFRGGGSDRGEPTEIVSWAGSTYWQ